MEKILLTIRKQVENNLLDQAWENIVPLINNNSLIEIFFLAGKIKMMQQDYGMALNYFNNVLCNDPSNIEAKAKIEYIYRILNIENTFYYENTYLDDGLYE